MQLGVSIDLRSWRFLRSGVPVNLALLVVGVWNLVRAFVGRDRSGEAALPGSDEPAPSGPEVGEPPAV